MEPIIHYIGHVVSELKSLEDCPLQEFESAPTARIHVYPTYTKGMRSFKTGDKVVILTWLHKGDRSIVECRPRRATTGPVIGVFSTRSPDRPNPVGLHHAKVVSITENEIVVDALEVLDQTPVIDIKPDLN